MTLTGFDWLVVAILVASTLLAYLRGIVKELVGLVAWVVGLVGAFVFAGPLGNLLPEIGDAPYLRYLIAFFAILIAALVIGAVAAWLLRGGVRAVGLGFVDRFLGAVFGVARGALIVLAMVLIAGSTGLATQDWWQNSRFAPWLARGALALEGRLPPVWRDKLDATLGRKPAEPVRTKV
jgi:membrane protein required for colicin V production